MKKELQEKAKELRRSGMSVKTIAKTLSCAISSVSVWVREIKLTPSQRESLDLLKKGIRGKTCSGFYARKRDKWFEEGRKEASKNNTLLLTICMLYWAEGSKSDNNSIQISNTDIDMLKIFVLGLKKIYNCSDEDIYIEISSYSENGLSEEEIKNAVSTRLEVAKDRIKNIRFDVDRRVRSGKKKNKHPYGIVRVSVYNTEIKQKLLGSTDFFKTIFIS